MDTQNKHKETERPKIENHMENCNVFMGDSYGGVFPLPGAQVTVNQYLDPKKMKNGTGQQINGQTETAEDREKRKLEVMKSITDRFDFEENQLGYDSNKKRVTNIRLATLFRRCFGLGGAHPSQANHLIQEQLWVLLIDERNQCNKEAGEGFFRQTVLNILGKFHQCEILFGTKNALMQVVFPKAHEGLTKNIERGIPTSFPEGTDEMINFYIDQLMRGEF